MTEQASGYQGPIKIYGEDSVLLTAGGANLVPHAETGGWEGVVSILKGSAVAGKALYVTLETPDGRRGRAQLIPNYESGEYAASSVLGQGPAPF